VTYCHESIEDASVSARRREKARRSLSPPREKVITPPRKGVNRSPRQNAALLKNPAERNWSFDRSEFRSDRRSGGIEFGLEEGRR